MKPKCDQILVQNRAALLFFLRLQQKRAACSLNLASNHHASCHYIRTKLRQTLKAITPTVKPLHSSRYALISENSAMATEQGTASSSSAGAARDNAAQNNAADGTPNPNRTHDDSVSTSSKPGAASDAFLKVQLEQYQALSKADKDAIMMNHGERRRHRRRM